MAYEDNQIIVTKDLLDAATTSANAYADSGDAATLAAAKDYVDRRSALIWDEDAGEYTTDSLRVMLGSRADGLAYGVSIPKGSATACTKLGANAGIAVPTPGVIGTPAVDPYTLRGPFFYMEVNATVDADGFPHVTGIRGDGRFARDGSNGDVWILTPVLYWSWVETDVDVQIFVSDTQLSGMEPQPKAKLPDGNLRPFMLFAKYPLSVDSSGIARSISGTPIAARTVSHDSLITICKTATTGYAGKSYADDWYVKIMFLLKYATKNSQSVFAGVTNYNFQVAPAVAESGTTRIIIPTTTANNIPIGAGVMLGKNDSGSTDRNTTGMYNVFDTARVVSKEAYDSSNTAISVDAAAFSTATTYMLSTASWPTGGCDAVEGDGSPYNPFSGREPFTIQGIEIGHGMDEILGDVILKSDGSTGWQIYINPDSKNEATSVTSTYVASGKYLPPADADATIWTLYPSNAAGLLYGQGMGGSSSTGLGDASYVHGTSVSGTRQWRSLGSLWNSSFAGLWCVDGRYTLSDTRWNIGSRLSAIGRSQG
jgi:hypothetical protein